MYTIRNKRRNRERRREKRSVAKTCFERGRRNYVRACEAFPFLRNETFATVDFSVSAPRQNHYDHKSIHTHTHTCSEAVNTATTIFFWAHNFRWKNNGPFWCEPQTNPVSTVDVYTNNNEKVNFPTAA